MVKVDFISEDESTFSVTFKSLEYSTEERESDGEIRVVYRLVSPTPKHGTTFEFPPLPKRPRNKIFLNLDEGLMGYGMIIKQSKKLLWESHHPRLPSDVGGDELTDEYLSLLLRQLKNLDEVLADYGQEVEALAASPRYREPVKALTCYKGIKHLFALTMITEIGDVKRFSHPRQLVSWVGMDIREYASGGKSNRLGITRQGNRYLRTAFIEANQRGYRTTRLSKDIKARRANTNPEYIAIADRCLRRLSKKGNRLLLAGKHPNKVKVACAREMVGFVWESLNRAAA